MSYTHLTLEERKYLQKLLSEGYSIRKASAVLERSPSTISREIQRNRAKYRPHGKIDNPYWYNHWHAQNLYITRRRVEKSCAIKEGSEAWLYILEKLEQYWSPEAICGRWEKDFPERKKLSFSTLYRYIKAGKFGKGKGKTHLRRRCKRIQTRNANYNTIQPDRIIPEWPEEIQKRSVIGHWEGDTVYGGIGKGLLITLVDRKTRFLRMCRIKSRDSELTGNGIMRLLHSLPVKSISLDNGSEFAAFRTIEKELKAPIYFAEPHKPWQRGTNENTNDIIRFFFRKGFDFRNVSDAEIAKVEDLINNRPRKCLNWRSPAEAFFENCVALA